jgi:hypothetical protein
MEMLALKGIKQTCFAPQLKKGIVVVNNCVQKKITRKTGSND